MLGAVALLASLPMMAAADFPAQLSAVDQAAAFSIAGFVRIQGQWRKCDDPGTAGYSPGKIAWVGDINGDGLPEVIITEGSAFCHGSAGEGTTLVSKQATGPWKVLFDGTGVVSVLTSSGAHGYRDLEVGGPGFCFPVLRWNGAAYAVNRHEYEGKRCRP